MPREAGSLNTTTEMLIRVLAKAEGDTIIEQLLKYLSAAQFGKFKLTQAQGNKLASLRPDGMIPPTDTKPPRRRRRNPPPEIAYEQPRHKEPFQC